MTNARTPVTMISCRLRPASAHDAALLWEWANDSEVRRQSFHPEPIRWDAHVTWFRGKLSDPQCLIAILEDEQADALGQIRFDNGAEGLEVDISIAASRRGQRLGGVLLQLGLEQALRRWKAGTLVRANVLADNRRSIRLFERSGFRPSRTVLREGLSSVQLERTL